MPIECSSAYAKRAVESLYFKTRFVLLLETVRCPQDQVCCNPLAMASGLYNADRLVNQCGK